MRAMRACAKPNCGSEAVATVALRYESKRVLVVDLLPQPDRNLVDLCDTNAGRLKPPLGWDIVDERSVMSPILGTTSS